MIARPAWRTIDWSSHVREAEVTGRRVRYLDYGLGPPVLLVHGMAGSWESWIENIPTLGACHRVIAVDLPGFGGSDPLPPNADFAGYARVIEALLHDLGVGPVAVFGHSLGGLVALSLAAESPERVQCLVLVSGGGAELSRLRLAAIQAAFWCLKVLLRIPAFRALLRHSRVARLLVRPAVHDPRAVLPELLQAMLPREVTPGFMDAVRLGAVGLRNVDLASVRAPALLVWGREDRILPLANAVRLREQLQDAELVVIDAVGHCAMFEAPGYFGQLAQAFLDTHQNGTDGMRGFRNATVG